jgi:hypothetical protein
MRFSAILCLLILVACGCKNFQAKLLSEQKVLKDSANNLDARIGDDMSKGLDGSAQEKKLQLQAVRARLIDIQSSLDSLAKVK